MLSTSASAGVSSLREQLVQESCSMVRHLVTNGARVPAQLVYAIEQFESASAKGQPVDMAALATAHERLSRLVAPAKPGTIYQLDDRFHQVPTSGRGTSLGPIKLVRDLIRVAMVCVGVFIVLSVLFVADAHNAIDLVTLFDRNGDDRIGMTFLRVVMERVFWLSAAGIGASFAMLFQLNDQIVSRTYDPDETASYWVKFFLGVVAGFILVALVPFDTTADSGADALTPPAIALLGGFSASAVYRILTRMVEALESVFSGGAKEQVLTAEKAAVTRAAEETAQARMAVAGQLVDIQQRLAAGMTPDEAAARLRQVVSALVPTSPDDTAAPPADKVPAFAVVAAPEDVAAQPDASALADASAAEEEQPRETAEAVG